MADQKQSPNEIIIEIATPKNQNYMFGPLGHVRIRGRWDFNKVAGRFSHESMKAINKITSIIPGECLAVDIEAKRCRLFDPLRETEKGQALWAKIAPIIDEYHSHFQCGSGLREPIVRDNCDADTIKTWLYYMRRAVDANYAKVLGNKPLPSLDEIKAMPGRREIGFFANTQYDTDEKREKAKWTDIVPEKLTAARSKATT